MSDEQLITLLNAGHKTAFDELFKRFFSHLCFFANRLIKNEDDAQDIAITAIEHVIINHKDFKTFSNLKAFLYITTRNKCLKFIEADKRFTKDGVPEVPTYDYVEAQMIRSEVLQAVYESIQRLPPQQRKIIEMLFIEDKNNTEIAKTLNIKLADVYSSKLKGMNKLRSILADKNIM